MSASRCRGSTGRSRCAARRRSRPSSRSTGCSTPRSLFSNVVKGRISRIDTAAAEAAPGVALVMTHLNAPRMADVPLFMTQPKAAGGIDLPIMQDDRIHWNGQPIAVVLAETQEQADHARSLIRCRI